MIENGPISLGIFPYDLYDIPSSYVRNTKSELIPNYSTFIAQQQFYFIVELPGMSEEMIKEKAKVKADMKGDKLEICLKAEKLFPSPLAIQRTFESNIQTGEIDFKTLTLFRKDAELVQSSLKKEAKDGLLIVTFNLEQDMEFI
eukprot:TRINITY_DN22184_c0_g1_i1.p1 TRINITY_DN22184_c0_g1~~TRINITY_DN22184_c0_g1_i1.p1  ORF type:complete len:144 (-),score=28.84 TRINITY_DN22184_c0_g1_i1:15-446(-)